MSSSISSVSQKEALARIDAFESQIGPFQGPIALAQLFRKTIIEDVPGKTSTREVCKRFTITTESQSLGSEMIRRVQQEMGATLEAAKVSQLSTRDAALVSTFENQLVTFNKMQEFETLRTDQSVPITPPKTLTVKEIKDQLNAKKIFEPFFTIPFFSITTLVLAVAAMPFYLPVLLASSTIPIVVILNLLVGVFALSFALVTLTGIEIGIKYTFFFPYDDPKRLDKATSPEEIVPLFPRMKDKIKATFLVHLGPSFRAQVLRHYEEKSLYKSPFVLKACAWAEALQSNEVPKDLKEKAMQELFADEDFSFRAVEKELQKAGLIPLT